MFSIFFSLKREKNEKPAHPLKTFVKYKLLSWECNQNIFSSKLREVLKSVSLLKIFFEARLKKNLYSAKTSMFSPSEFFGQKIKKGKTLEFCTGFEKK